jgi:hypothetical protein
MSDSKGDYYEDDFLQDEPIIKIEDEMFEDMVDSREPEIDERREMRESLQP